MSDQPSSTTTGAGSPPPPAAPPRRRLVRLPDDRIVAGVGSGLAHYLDIDPAIVRIGLVVLAFLGPGVPLYVAAWLLLPEADASEVHRAAITRRSGPTFWIGVGLLVIASLALADDFGFLGRDVLWPLVLIGIGVALWRVGQDRDHTEAPPADAPPAAASPPPARQETVMASTPTATSSPPSAPPPATRPGRPPEPAWEPPPPREPSLLGRFTAAVVLMSLGAAFLLDRADLVEVTGSDALALVLIVLGVGLVVGTWFGRARWLIPAGFVVIPFLLFASFLQSVDVPFGDGIGERNYDVSTPGALRNEYTLGAGELTLDLSDLALDGRTEQVAASVGAGQLLVRVPSEVSVDVDAAAAIGELRLLDAVRDDGTRLERVVSDAGIEGAGRLRLDLQVGAGQIRVERAPGLAPPAPLDAEPLDPEPTTAPTDPAASTAPDEEFTS